MLAVIFLRGDQLVELGETIQKGTPLFLVLAVLLQLGKYMAQGGAYIFCFKSVDAPLRFREAIKLVFGTFFMNTVAPSFNLAGVTLVVDDSKKRGISTGQATSAALLMQVTIDSGFVMVMLLGFGILSLTVGLQPGWFALGMVAVLLVGGLVTFSRSLAVCVRNGSSGCSRPLSTWWTRRPAGSERSYRPVGQPAGDVVLGRFRHDSVKEPEDHGKGCLGFRFWRLRAS